MRLNRYNNNCQIQSIDNLNFFTCVNKKNKNEYFITSSIPKKGGTDYKITAKISKKCLGKVKSRIIQER